MGPGASRIKPEIPIAAEAVRLALSRILGSVVFQRSDRVRALLQYLVESTLVGNRESLKESVIGVQVFQREGGYDPKLDPVVRVSARRLRRKLEIYYAGPGSQDPLRIHIPKGGYIPEFLPYTDRQFPALPLAKPYPATQAHRRIAWLIVASLAAALLAAALSIFGGGPPPPGIVDGRPFTTYTGYEAYPAFSPDGATIAFTWDGPAADNRDIYLQRIGADGPVRFTTDPASDTSPVWSPDGGEIAFLRQVDSSHSAIHIAPVLGNGDRVVAELRPPVHDRLYIDWSPDGKWFASFECNASDERSGIVLIARDTGEKRRLTTPPGVTFGDANPRFSPDGRSIAFRRSVGMSVDDVYIVPVEGGELRRLTHDDRGISSLAWSVDGKSVIVGSKRSGFISALWSFPIAGGEPRRLTPATVESIQPAVSRRGNRMAYVQTFYDVNIWRAAVDGSASAAPILDSTLVDSSPQFSPDGNLIAFRSSRSGADEIWISDAKGGNARRLTNFRGALTGSPRWSPDGQQLVFESRASGTAQIYLIARDGAGQRRVTSDAFNNSVPNWSRDGRYLYFASDRTGAWQVWRQPVSGGGPTMVTTHGGFTAVESQDGGTLYFARNDGPGLWSGGLDKNGVAGGEHLVTNDLETGMWGNWALAADGIYYIAKRQLRHVSFDGKSRQILALTAPPAAMDSGLAVSPDQRTILYCQIDRTGSDIILVDPFR